MVPKIQEQENKMVAISTKDRFLRLGLQRILISAEEIYVTCT